MKIDLKIVIAQNRGLMMASISISIEGNALKNINAFDDHKVTDAAFTINFLGMDLSVRENVVQTLNRALAVNS